MNSTTCKSLVWPSLTHRCYLQMCNAGCAWLVQLHINILALHFGATYAPVRLSGSAILVPHYGCSCSSLVIEGAAQQVRRSAILDLVCIDCQCLVQLSCQVSNTTC